MQTSTVQLVAKEFHASHVRFLMHLLGRRINLAGMPGEGKTYYLWVNKLDLKSSVLVPLRFLSCCSTRF